MKFNLPSISKETALKLAIGGTGVTAFTGTTLGAYFGGKKDGYNANPEHSIVKPLEVAGIDALEGVLDSISEDLHKLVNPQPALPQQPYLTLYQRNSANATRTLHSVKSIVTKWANKGYGWASVSELQGALKEFKD